MGWTDCYSIGLTVDWSISISVCVSSTVSMADRFRSSKAHTV